MRIKGPVGQHVICVKALDQFRHAAQIVGQSGQKAKVSHVSQRVHQRQYHGRDPTARFPDGLALNPPSAPLLARWTLTIDPSIITYSKSGLAAKAVKMR